MKRSKGMQLGSVLAAMLILMATIAVPVAMAETNTETGVETSETGCGTCGDQNSGSCGCCKNAVNGNVSVIELQGSEKNKAVADVLSNNEVKNLKEMLIEKGYKPKINEAAANKLIFKNESNVLEAVVVEIYFEKDPGSDIARIFFTSNGEKTKVGAGTIQKIDNSTNIEVFEYKNGEISTQKIVNDNGIISIDGKVVTASSDDCSMCLSVCQYVYAAGCSLGSYFLCIAACAPFAYAACIPICGVIYALICVYLANEQCPDLCEVYCQ